MAVSMLNYARASRAAFHQQWREQMTLSGSLAPMLSAIALAVGVGWIIGGSENPTALSHALVGVPLMGLWQMGAFRTGWVLEGERFQGTIDLMLTTRTPVSLVVFSKTLAIMASQAVTAAIALLILLSFAGELISVGHLPSLFISTMLAIGGVVAVSFVFAPLLFLVGGRGGYFNAIMPLGTVLSGFLYPTGLLPGAFEVIARFLPTAWAMEGVVRTTRGESYTVALLTDWLLAAVLIGAFLSLSIWLFRKAEMRVRVSGSLGVA
jgi:ABC-2 type transport system permease protein